MKFHIRDLALVIALIGLGLAWRNEAANHKKTLQEVQSSLERAGQRLQLQQRELETANSEADVLSEEVRRLRGVVKSSLADKRDWFELEVTGKKLVAIRPATSSTRTLTLETVELIESETGLEARRLRHFLTPIADLQLGKD